MWFTRALVVINSLILQSSVAFYPVLICQSV